MSVAPGFDEGSAALFAPTVPAVRTAPASFGQAGLWFLRQIMPCKTAYNTAVQLRLSGDVDAAALAAAVREVAQRHESLRTTFASMDGAVVQIVSPVATVDVEVVDLSHGGPPSRPGAREAEADRLARELAGAVFDLGRGPLLRARVLRLAPGEARLVVVVDHIVADGTSLGILWREIEALYPALREGRPSPLAPPARPYAEHVEAQRRWLATPAFARQLAYWTAHLAGAAACDLPADRPRPPARSYRGDLVVTSVPAPVVARLREACARDDVSLFAALLAALDVVIARWSGQRDVVVMVPMAGRQRFGAEEVIGYFANMVLLRTEVPDGVPFGALVGRVNKEIMAGVFRQDVPFARVVEALRPDRSLSDDPLARVSLSFFAAPGATLSLPGVASAYDEIPTGGAKFDLGLVVTERDEGLTLSAEHNLDVFDRAGVERLLAGLCAVLEAASADPSLPVQDLPILPADEGRRLLALAGGGAAFPVEACLHTIFQAQAARTPGAVAVRFEGQRLTYADLDARSRRVARALQRRGVGPGTLVGLAVDRGIDLVVGLVGILAAGGAYLPLDPDYPRDRLAFMIEDARVPVVVTLARHAHLFEGAVEAAPGRADPTLIRLDAGAEALARDDGPLEPARVRPEDLAYVIYTSGSTGKPKGVMVEHRQVVRLFHATQAWFGFDAGDVWTLFHSYAFDFSVWELWGALLHGGQLVVVPRAVARSPDAFYRLLVDEGVTVLNQTPSAFRQLVDAEGLVGAGEGGAGLALRYVIFGGEALRVSDLGPFWDRHGDARPALVNMYGITETTVHVTYRPLRRADLGRPWSSVIGAPLPDLSLHVLDAQRRPVPVGVPGELYVGGAGVARGYLNRPELTAERFLDDPFGGRGVEEGARLYRTGDLARRIEGGDVAYLGRIDHQVKIRGFRVELGEIEAALAQHPAVREAVVVAREETPGDVRLVAYVVPVGGALDVAALRAFLTERLLEAMLPAAFVALPALPLTSNGKIDRRALPAPGDAAVEQGAFVAPRTPAEALIAGIWADLLGLGRVSVTDDFFALGGHSLLGMRVVARLGAAFGVTLPVRAIFEARTVASLAERVEVARRSGEARAAPPITRAPRDAPPPLSFAQQRLWFLDQLEPDSAAYNIPTAVRLEGPLDAEALARSLAEIVRRHEALRTTFALVDGEPRQIVAEPSPSLLPLPVVSLEGLAGAQQDAEARRLATEDARRPFDLARGPLIRAALLRLAPRAHVLLMNMHHVASDGWSAGVLARELSALYGAFASGRASPLPELPLQYADYAVWQRTWLAGGVGEAQVAYWKRQLDGAPPSLDLPTAHPRKTAPAHRGAAHQARLPPELTAALRALCRREGVTLFMLLLAAFQLLLGRCSGQDDIVVGSPIAGRTRADVEGIVGLFLNTLALRTRLAGEPTFRALCARVREVTLEAYAHQDVPFERVIEAIAPPRDLGRTPVFQAYFNLLNLAPHWEDLAGVEAERWRMEDAIARFDLNLYAEEREGCVDLQLVYDSDLFDALQTGAMLAHLTEILRAVAADPDQPITRIPLPAPSPSAGSPGGRRGRPGPRFALFDGGPASIGQRFAEQAARAEGKAAIRAGAVEVSYADLAASAHRVAHAVGVDPAPDAGGPPRLPGRVALLFEPGPAMIAAILGALEAGATYVPLDLASPPGRLAAMIEDAGPRAMLAHAPTLARARALAPAGCPVIDVDALTPGPAPGPLGVPVSPEAPAYILYTSGSTGQPKGVVQSHRNVLHHIRAYVDRLHIDAGDTLSLLASYAFDAAVMDIFGALLSGATLCPIDLRGGGLTRLPALLRERGVSVYHSTPTVFRHLVGMLGEGEVLPGIRLVVLGGEEAQARDVEAFRAHFAPGGLLVNGLGPTESTLALQYFVDRETPSIPGESVPVGYPVEGTDVRLVTPMGEQTAIWGVGQIELRSAHLALGYWRAASPAGPAGLSTSAFPPDGEGGGRRVYRTGDLGRLLPGGAIAYQGRADHQIKVRGHRIEPAEIEACLLRHPGVAKAVVVLRRDVSGEPSLCAYVVPERGRALLAAELRAHAQEVLPPTMVPAAFVTLDALPLLPNGKVDRRALPAPERPDARDDLAPPRDDLEAGLAALFCEVLGLRTVSVRDSFFDLGGHSMLAVKLVQAIERRFHASVALVSLFEAQTVEQIAALIRTRGHERPQFSLVPVRAAGRKRPLFLVSRPNDNALGYVALGRHLDPDRPVYVLQRDYPEEGDLGRPYTPEEYQAWATSYVEAIRLVQPEGPYLIGGMCEGALIAFTMTGVLEAVGQRVAFLAMLDAWPLENTTRRLARRVFLYEKRLRALADLRPSERVLALSIAVQHRIERLRRPPDARPSGPRVNPWDARLYPGSDFVPPRVSTPITVLRAKRQPYWRIRDDKLGWSDRTRGGVDVHVVPGEHHDLLREPHVAEIARVLDACIGRADPPPGPPPEGPAPGER